MTHNEKRQHWLKEGAIGLGTGVLYGITSVAVGASSVFGLGRSFILLGCRRALS